MLKSQPNTTKFKKSQKRLSHIRGTNNKCCNLVYGDFGIRIMKGQFFSSSQLENLRLTSLWVMRQAKFANALVRFRVFPYRAITKKPEEIRMGGGKADVHHWAAPVKSNTILCEFLNIDLATAKKLYKQFNARISGVINLVEKDKIESKASSDNEN